MGSTRTNAVAGLLPGKRAAGRARLATWVSRLALASALGLGAACLPARAQAPGAAGSLEKAQEPAPQSPASAPTTNRFDGDWDVHLTCPSNTEASGARGYTYDFPASVLNGRLFGSHGEQGTAGSLQVEGTIAPDGQAQLQARGRTASPEYAVKKPPTGTAYSYYIEAHFDGAKGSGRRLQDRVCDLAFSRR